jgi:hypothetical protein
MKKERNGYALAELVVLIVAIPVVALADSFNSVRLKRRWGCLVVDLVESLERRQS